MKRREEMRFEEMTRNDWIGREEKRRETRKREETGQKLKGKGERRS